MNRLNENLLFCGRYIYSKYPCSSAGCSSDERRLIKSNTAGRGQLLNLRSLPLDGYLFSKVYKFLELYLRLAVWKVVWETFHFVDETLLLTVICYYIKYMYTYKKNVLSYPQNEYRNQIDRWQIWPLTLGSRRACRQ